MNMHRKYPLGLLGLVSTLLLLIGCYTPPPIPAVTTPIPVPLRYLFLDTDDLPKFSSVVEWQRTEPYALPDKWDWTNAIAAMNVWFLYGTSTSASQTIVQYGDSAGAESIWREMRDHGVMPELSGKPIDFLDEQELPPLHADNIALHCENYYSTDSKVPSHVNCVARLQYDVLYVEVQTPVTGGRLSRSQFYSLIVAADERMRLIWEDNLSSNTSTPTSTSE